MAFLVEPAQSPEELHPDALRTSGVTVHYGTCPPSLSVGIRIPNCFVVLLVSVLLLLGGGSVQRQRRRHEKQMLEAVEVATCCGRQALEC